MESYASTRMRPVNHSPTRAARRAVIHRVESEYERFDCISDMHKFGVKVHIWTETSDEITAWNSYRRCGPWAAFFLFCSCVSNKPQCKGVICQTKFGISDDADVSSESGSVRVLERQSCWHFGTARQLTRTKHTARASQIFCGESSFRLTWFMIMICTHFSADSRSSLTKIWAQPSPLLATYRN